jgi:formate hydrogenlyase transcriptional activator
MGRRIETIPAEAMDALVHYPWPGNIRELQNLIERAVILSPGPTLHVALGELKQPAAPTNGSPATLAEAEREHVLAALRETNWVIGGAHGAAARLGLPRSTLYRVMKKLGLSRTGGRPPVGQSAPGTSAHATAPLPIVIT